MVFSITNERWRCHVALNRRSFLRALIGVPFAAKALERIISNGVAAPITPTPEPAWMKPSAVPPLLPYQQSGMAVPTVYPGIVRIQDAPYTLQPGDLVKVNGDGTVEKCEQGDPMMVGWVVGTHVGCRSDGPIDWHVDVQPYEPFAMVEMPRGRMVWPQ